jgi:hypothetical protein
MQEMYALASVLRRQQLARGYSHALYVGALKYLKVTGSYFHHANIGHLLKSRALSSEILYNRFTDEAGGRASYELNFPNGGSVQVIGNLVQQVRTTDNSVMISYGEEGLTWSHEYNELHLVGNTLVNEHPHGGRFLRVAPHLTRGGAWNNALVGVGLWRLVSEMADQNNPRLSWTELAAPWVNDYRIASDAIRLKWIDPPYLEGRPSLRLNQAYVHPRKLKKLRHPPQWVGADQEAAY